jgi:hypothetical protein
VPIRRYAFELRERVIGGVEAGFAGRVPPESRRWAAHAVVAYLVEAVLNWLEFRTTVEVDGPPPGLLDSAPGKLGGGGRHGRFVMAETFVELCG